MENIKSVATVEGVPSEAVAGEMKSKRKELGNRLILFSLLAFFKVVKNNTAHGKVGEGHDPVSRLVV